FDLRIPFAVAAYIRKAIRCLGIGPPVGAHAHVVVLVSAGRSCLLVHHGEWAFFHDAVSGIAKSCREGATRIYRIEMLLFDQRSGIEQEDPRLRLGLWPLCMECLRSREAKRGAQKTSRRDLFTSHALSHQACDL